MKAWRALEVCLLTSLLPSCSSPGEAKELVEWSERSAEAYCRCTSAADPGACADEIPQELLLSSDNFADLIARFRGRGGERSTAELKRARECEQTLIAWRLARTAPSTSPSAVPSTTGSASNAAPTLIPSASTSSVTSPSASSVAAPRAKGPSENNSRNPLRL